MSAKLGAANSQAAGALESDGGNSALPSNRYHPLVADAVNYIAQAKKFLSKLSGVQPDKTRAIGSWSVQIIIKFGNADTITGKPV